MLLHVIDGVAWPEPISSSATSRASSTCSASSAPSATTRAAKRAKLIAKFGRKANMMKWREMLNADCPKRELRIQDRCDLVCPDLPKVL